VCRLGTLLGTMPNGDPVATALPAPMPSTGCAEKKLRTATTLTRTAQLSTDVTL
jgi:hypothetical protein